MSREVTVTAEWAVWGKHAGASSDYGILHCSKGQFTHDDFREIMIKWAPGTHARLPQVTISWVNGRGDRAHVGLAIQSWSDQHDGFGRLNSVTSYFCVPYDQLAEGPVSYQSLYQVFSECSLPAGGPLTVGVPVLDPQEIALRVDATTMAAAALLLTDEPVCVVGGDSLTMPDRLGYLDAVAALLPYGLRTRLTASTWTDSAAMHRIKLSFAKHPRAGAHAVAWGTQGTSAYRWDDVARRYFERLAAHPSGQVVTRLAEGREPLSFKDAPNEALALLDDSKNTLVHRVQAVPGDVTVDDDLLRCAELLDLGLFPDLDVVVARLLRAAKAQEPTDEQRERHREIIETRLFPAEAKSLAADLGDPFYDMVLTLGYGRTLTVETLDAIVKATARSWPARVAMRRMRAAEPTVLVRLALFLGGEEGPDLASLATPDLVEAAAREPIDPAVVNLVLRELLTRGEVDDPQIAPALIRHAYLADAIAAAHPEDPGEQLRSMRGLLVAAYGRSFDADSFEEVVRGLLTPARAMLITALAATHGRGAEEMLLEGVLRGARLDRRTRRHLTEQLAGPAPEDLPVPARGVARLFPRRRRGEPARGLGRRSGKAAYVAGEPLPDPLVPVGALVVIILFVVLVVAMVVAVLSFVSRP